MTKDRFYVHKYAGHYYTETKMPRIDKILFEGTEDECYEFVKKELEHRIQMQNYNKAYYKKNKELIKAKRAKKKDKNIAYQRNYYQKKKQQINESLNYIAELESENRKAKEIIRNCMEAMEAHDCEYTDAYKEAEAFLQEQFNDRRTRQRFFTGAI